jgi:hypothetical protein
MCGVRIVAPATLAICKHATQIVKGGNKNQCFVTGTGCDKISARWVRMRKGKLNQGLYNRRIDPRRGGHATSALHCLCNKWRTVGGNGQIDLLAKHTQNRGGREGGVRVSWGLKEAGNSLARNFSDRSAGPPPG